MITIETIRLPSLAERPLCHDCGIGMWLSSSNPNGRGFNCTFECPACGTVETSVVVIGSNEKPPSARDRVKRA